MSCNEIEVDHAALIRDRRRGDHTVGPSGHIVPGDGGEVAADVERLRLGRRREESDREERAEEEEEGKRRARSHGETRFASLSLLSCASR